GGDDPAVGLAGGSAADEPVLGAPVALLPRVGEGVPVALAVVEPRDLTPEQILKRLGHGVTSPRWRCECSRRRRGRHAAPRPAPGTSRGWRAGGGGTPPSRRW